MMKNLIFLFLISTFLTCAFAGTTNTQVDAVIQIFGTGLSALSAILIGVLMKWLKSRFP